MLANPLEWTGYMAAWSGQDTWHGSTYIALWNVWSLETNMHYILIFIFKVSEHTISVDSVARPFSDYVIIIAVY